MFNSDDEKQTCYIRVSSIGEDPILFKIWFRNEERKATLMQKLREQFKEATGQETVVEELEQLEGLRACGLYILCHAPSWEYLVQQGALEPLISPN